MFAAVSALSKDFAEYRTESTRQKPVRSLPSATLGKYVSANTCLSVVEEVHPIVIGTLK